MLTLDGSRGEGGGQILRTALSLSLVTATPFRIEKIRARRSRPGLMRQHLTAVRAAARVGNAQVDGDSLGSAALTFRPSGVRAGHYDIDVGSAGSTTLVFETVLPALLVAGARSTIRLEGGTHNPLAPPYEFLQRSFVPLVQRTGPRVEVRLERAGFYPAGGGILNATIEPASLRGFELIDRGAIRSRRVTALVSHLPESIADRELVTARQKLGWGADCFQKQVVRDALGPGNLVTIEIVAEQVTELIAAFGMRGVRAEAVAEEAARQALAYLSSEAPVGEHLADQLMLPLALAGEGRYRTASPSEHARTNAGVIREFLPLDLTPRQVSEHVWEICVRRSQ